MIRAQAVSSKDVTVNDIVSTNLLGEISANIPEFMPMYERLKEKNSEIKRDIDKPRRIFYHLAYFMILANSKAKNPALEGPDFEDIDELLRRTMLFVERASVSPDKDIQEAVDSELLRIIRLMEAHFAEIVQHAGSNTKERLWSKGISKKFHHLFD
jgi:hypothetical protein